MTTIPIESAALLVLVALMCGFVIGVCGMVWCNRTDGEEGC